MNRQIRKRWGVVVAAALVVATLGGCGTPPAQSTAQQRTNFIPCVVSDSGGFVDRSFNQLSLAGVKEAAAKVGSGFRAVQSSTVNDLAPNINNLITQRCSVIVAPGFNLIDPVANAAKANAGAKFAMIDDNSIVLPNVKPIVYATDQAAFLAGYAAAAYSKTKVVATYGGQAQPPVTLYMDGFWSGVQYYNKSTNANVRVLGWDQATQQGSFVGDFTSQNISRTIANNFLNQGADVIMPVAAALYQGAGSAIRSSGADAVLVGVDSDLHVADTSGYGDLMLTSVLKNIQPTVATVVEQAASESAFDNSQYVGTLQNDGVGLAPFYQFDTRIPPDLQSQLAHLKAGIVDGSIRVGSPSSLT